MSASEKGLVRSRVAVFSDDLILVDVAVKDRVEIINLLSGILEEKGCVTKDYAAAVNERESSYPTGLPTEGVKVAIPHADAKHVIRPAVALAVLKQPVFFNSMENPDETLNVEIVIMLANRDSGEQLENLQALTGLFADSSLLLQVCESGCPGEIASMLNTRLS